MGVTITSAALSFAEEKKDSEIRLPGTEQLDWEDPLDVCMMTGAHAFVERKIREAATEKSARWSRDFRSGREYDASIEPNRKRLRFILGATSKEGQSHTHLAFPPPTIPISMQRLIEDDLNAAVPAEAGYRVVRVRWPVLEGVFGEGLLLEPKQAYQASAVVVPDADQSPEALAGVVTGMPWERQLARRLAENGVRVLVPTLIDRRDVAAEGELGQSNREWIYRQAFHMGRHIIGYEVNKIEAAIDWLAKSDSGGHPIGLAGWGEGALLALYTAALDTRVDATLISGDWKGRGPSWREPIYRNLWSWMNEFDDADLASMVAPRTLVVEQSHFPTIDDKRDKAALGIPRTDGAEVATILDSGQLLKETAEKTGTQMGEAWKNWLRIVSKGEPTKQPYCEVAQTAFANGLSIRFGADVDQWAVHEIDGLQEVIAERHRRQLVELDAYTQRLVRDSSAVRESFYRDKALPVLAQRKWSTQAVHETTPVEEFTKRSPHYRKVFADEILGRFDDPLLPANPKSRMVKKTEAWDAYDVVLDVVPDLFAWGILMLPEGYRDGPARPVVVIQHGRNGLPANVMNGGYNGIAEKLLNKGFIIFAPHNLYRGEDAYRWLDRKANAIGKSLFSFLLLQHEQILNWLASLSQVDGDRIAFYGNSYGGESAVRLPTVLTDYALSICASDFNDWTRKVADTHDPHSFMNTIEWEMPYFNMGETFSYAEMAYLMVPRPFMVERGHHDLVAPDHWVASEYAKVRLVYDQLGIGDRTDITFFQGGHTMRGEETVRFLMKHLDWPRDGRTTKSE